MSLIRKQKITKKNLAAKRSNGNRSRGAVTPAGKARAAAANLRHGFYSQARSEAMLALGENPADYARLLESLMDDLQPKSGLQGEVVSGMARALWRMQRSERMQDGLALKRVQSGLQKEDLLNSARLLQNYNIYHRLTELGRALNRPDYVPSPADIQAFVTGFGAKPPEDIQKLFPLLSALGEAATEQPNPANECHGGETVDQAAGGQDAESLRQELSKMLTNVACPYNDACTMLVQQSDTFRSPENIAALMAPKDENAIIMQKMEDSSLRQLWRLTDLFLKIKQAQDSSENGEDAA